MCREMCQVRNWMFTTFYVAAELWGDVVLSLLFWGLANEMTTMKEVKIFCFISGLLPLMPSAATLFCGALRGPK